MASLVAAPQGLPAAAPLVPASLVQASTEEPRAICLRHDRNQVKKRCTCGKARRYRPGRGYPPAEHGGDALRAEAVEPLCAALRTHTPNAHVAEWCCRGLRHALADAPSRALVAQRHGVALLVAVLRAHARAPAVVREALHALANLAGDDDGDAHAQVALQIAQSGGSDLVVVAMADYPTDLTFQAPACAVIGHTYRADLAAGPRHGARAALAPVVRALATHVADELCQALACYAIGSLCEGHIAVREAAATLDALGLVDATLQRFPRSKSVKRWGTHAKAALTGQAAVPLGPAAPAGLNIGPPVVAQVLPTAWTPGAFPQ